MLFWAIVIICGLALAALFIRDEYEDAGDIIPAFFVGIFGAAFGALIAFIVCAVISSAINEHTETTETVSTKELVALKDDVRGSSNASGGFFLFVGGYSATSSEDLEYAWYEKDSDGAMILHDGVQNDYNTTVKIYDLPEGETPYVEHIETEDVHATPDWVAPVQLNWHIGDDYEVYAIHVPTGTVKEQYEVDLK